ncbi:MAG: DIP1984 family protein [Solirubrobacterales bacterium]
MRLGEALARRAELQSRLVELRERLSMSTLVQEGDSPPENPDTLIEALDQAADELEQLIANINRTNAQTEFRSGRTLTDALAQRDVLGLRHGALKAAADATAQQRARYSRSEIRVITTFDVGAIRNRLDQLARERRELDADIQALNWTVDLAE